MKIIDKMLPSFINRLISVMLASIVMSCSSTPDSEHLDPLEPINRSFWTFTWEYSDKYVTRPASLAYVEYTPKVIRNGLYNVALNLNEPSAIVNSALQLEFKDSAKSTGRFLVNSTFGLLGFFDLATEMGLPRKHEEFGEVLGKYGVGDGPFLMFPVIGPSSVREEVGDYVDELYWPMAVIDFWPNIARMAIIGLEERAKLVEQESLINEAIDSYEFMKTAYFQNMNYKVHDGAPPIEVNQEEEAALDDFLDELDGLE